MVGILFEDGCSSPGSNTVTKTVMANGEAEALRKAKKLVEKDYPEIDYINIWSWHIEQLNESETHRVLEVI